MQKAHCAELTGIHSTRTALPVHISLRMLPQSARSKHGHDWPAPPDASREERHSCVRRLTWVRGHVL